jgi:hypothetical protein
MVDWRVVIWGFSEGVVEIDDDDDWDDFWRDSI